jgi:hypothetical protein
LPLQGRRNTSNYLVLVASSEGNHCQYRPGSPRKQGNRKQAKTDCAYATSASLQLVDPKLDGPLGSSYSVRKRSRDDKVGEADSI